MEEGPDFISNLPHDILRLIASMIPLKEAIRTAALSNSWRSLWAPSQVKLDLGPTNDQDGEKIKQVLGAFSMYYDYPEKLKLYHQPVDYSNKKRADYPNSENESFALVTKGAQGELHFDFSGGENLNSTEFNLVLETGATPSCPRFSSLKSLQLRSVTHVAKNLVAGLFSSCQFLESLRLEKCKGLQNVDIKAHNSFKSFAVVDCFDIKSIRVSASSLKTFSYKGILPTVELNYSPELVDAMLDFRDGLSPIDFNCHDVLVLLCSIKDVEKLTISGWLLEWLCTAGVIFGRLEFEFDKLKEFLWIDSVMDTRKRDSLACFLNMTPSLERLLVKIDRNCSSVPSPILHEYWHEPHLWMDYAEVKCNSFPLKYLKTIEIVGFTGKANEILLLDLLLHKALNLKDVVVISPETDAWRLTVIPRSQLDCAVKPNSLQKHKLVPSPNGNSLYVLIEAKRHGVDTHVF